MDKLKHFAACLAITLIVGLIHPIFGAAVAMAVGVAKEVYDSKRGGEFDWLDIAADVVGTLCGFAFYLQ